MLTCKEAVMECDFFFFWRLGLLCFLYIVWCTQQNKTLHPAAPPFVCPATLTDSTFPNGDSFKAFPSSFVTCSLTPHFPPSPRQTALCPSVCLLCRRSLIRKKMNKTNTCCLIESKPGIRLNNRDQRKRIKRHKISVVDVMEWW